MPPPNQQRRDRLADTAIGVLAERGSRGLTHRAVDAAAEVPPGTTSRYFRTRDALLAGAVERTTGQLLERIAAVRIAPLGLGDLEDALVTVLTTLLTEDSHHPRALFEIHLEAARVPQVRDVLTQAMRGRQDLIQQQCRAAGLDISDEDALLLEMSVLGVLFTALTTGVPGDMADYVRTAVRALLTRWRE
jgi:DNA-binding transcriptional regulator YbjK